MPTQVSQKYPYVRAAMCSFLALFHIYCACKMALVCSGYAIKRRLLREHRVQMRVMDNVIRQHKLEDDAQDAMVEETGNAGFYLGTDSEMDEESDVSDPEQELRAAAADQGAMVQAVQGALECRGVLQDMERARMQLEDVRSGLLR